MWQPRPRPEWVTELNAMAAGAGGAERLVSLAEDDLLTAAQEAAGLEDFGDDGYRDPMRLFLEGLEDDARLHLVGRTLARADLVRTLVNRLEITETFRAHPEIADERVEAPVFITGMGRSGTSILHELLAADPGGRAPLTWELLHPCPPPEAATYRTDPRIELADREWRFWDQVTPEYRTMHENRGDAPNECLFVTLHEFRSDYWTGGHRVPAFARWLATADLGPAYAFHRRFLQLLQWRCPGEPWVLKAPSHLSALPALFAEYPDARVVITHRDPAEVLGSVIDLMVTLRWQRSDHVDRAEIAGALAGGYPIVFQLVEQWRADGTIPDEQIVDVRYTDLLTDPWTTIADVYERLDLSLGDEALAAMQSHLAAKPKDRHGAHRYDLSDLALDLSPFAPYTRWRK